jgi:type IV secretory pathway TrbD component
MYRALCDPHLLAGCERTSFFALVGLCTVFGFFGGIAAGRWYNLVLAVVLFTCGKLALGHAAKVDPQLRQVAVQSHRYGKALLAVPPVKESR